MLARLRSTDFISGVAWGDLGSVSWYDSSHRPCDRADSGCTQQLVHKQSSSPQPCTHRICSEVLERCSLQAHSLCCWRPEGLVLEHTCIHAKCNKHYCCITFQNLCAVDLLAALAAIIVQNSCTVNHLGALPAIRDPILMCHMTIHHQSESLCCWCLRPYVCLGGLQLTLLTIH